MAIPIQSNAPRPSIHIKNLLFSCNIMRRIKSMAEKDMSIMNPVLSVTSGTRAAIKKDSANIPKEANRAIGDTIDFIFLFL